MEGWQGESFLCRHVPDPSLLIIGHGEEAVALARLALAYPAAAKRLSPDSSIVDQSRSMGASGEVFRSPRSKDAVMADAFTAIIFLFHDHDWEADLMMKAVATPAYFIGAMGSRDTHDRRCARLRHREVSALNIQRIIGPVGLIHGARDADRLAVSILAQLVAASDSDSHSIGRTTGFRIRGFLDLFSGYGKRLTRNIG